MATDYHAKLFAFLLSRRHSGSDAEKIASALVDAQVDLIPHQVEAALFAFKSPQSKGVILADEVGLGKTIEAGLVLSQKRAEGKQRFLIITPAHLQKQWEQELLDKFNLRSCILDSKQYQSIVKYGHPFLHDEAVICSYQFAAKHADKIKRVTWDLVIIDEAHRLRNVYKPNNKTARAIKGALTDSPKILLTATPLQNSLVELYGLISIIDDFAFGDESSFREQYLNLKKYSSALDELKERIKDFCRRTLRQQVAEHISYTNRLPITQEFDPNKEELELYDEVSEYLRRPFLNAVPSGQRKLMTLIMRKLLSSSTFAIAGTLDTLKRKLENKLKDDTDQRKGFEEEIKEDFEWHDENADEQSNSYDDEDALLSAEDIDSINKEIEELSGFHKAAQSISENAKGQALLKALGTGFAKAEELGAAKKAIVFTESRRTQEYLFGLLTENNYEGEIVLFNGTNSDQKSKEIYQEWVQRYKNTDRVTGTPRYDMRTALIDYFRDEASVMIATEAAAEGLNLQFCSMVVNYDLPWNPQKIEQRIGRCHRYGQEFDVIVVNFLNKQNAADQRVFELLDEKFKLFSGVFGASDEILGVIEGVDIEKRISSIYQQCRSAEEIKTEFDALRNDMEEQIATTMEDTRMKLLQNFDAEVHDRLKTNHERSKGHINDYEYMLWGVARHELKELASFDDKRLTFNLNSIPKDAETKRGNIPTGSYGFAKDIQCEHRFRLSDCLAQYVISKAKEKSLSSAQLIFEYSKWDAKAASIESLVGKTGILSARYLSVTGFDEQDHVLSAAVTDDGQEIDSSIILRLFKMPCSISNAEADNFASTQLNTMLEKKEKTLVKKIRQHGYQWLKAEEGKVEKWTNDRFISATRKLNKAESQINKLERMAKEQTPEEQRSTQKKIQKLRNDKEQQIRLAKEEHESICEQRDQLIAGLKKRLHKQEISNQDIFTVRWKVV